MKVKMYVICVLVIALALSVALSRHKPRTVYARNCAAGLQKCGEGCYNPSYKKCINNVICNPTDQLCGRSTCYDPNVYSCENGTLKHK